MDETGFFAGGKGHSEKRVMEQRDGVVTEE